MVLFPVPLARNIVELRNKTYVKWILRTTHLESTTKIELPDFRLPENLENYDCKFVSRVLESAIESFLSGGVSSSRRLQWKKPRNSSLKVCKITKKYFVVVGLFLHESYVSVPIEQQNPIELSPVPK